MISMVTTNISKHHSWKKVFNKSTTEFEPTPLSVISGSIPEGLRGSFYRNGPGLFERNGETISHWFDGDGAILGVHFDDNGATGVYRFVETDAYKSEAKAGKFSFGSYGRTPSGSFWKQLTLPLKNTANSGVLALEDRILALWSAGAPYALTSDKLTTLGFDRLLGLESDESPYSSKPKIDPQTRDIYNFGVNYGTKATLKLYRNDRTGKIQQQGELPLDGFPYIHNFVMAGEYLIFFIPPLRLQLLPFLTKRRSFSESLSWEPDKGTQVLIVDRNNFSLISEGKTDPWFAWSFSNGYVDDRGTVRVEVVRYEDFAIDRFLKEIPSPHISSSNKGKLYQLNLNPFTGKVISTKQLMDRPCEYPTVAPANVGKSWDYTYLSVYRQGSNFAQNLPETIGCFDRITGTLIEADLGENRYASGPIYAPCPNNSHMGWILTEVFDADNDKSELWIFAADKLDREPVCKLSLPEVIPFGFDGTWQSSP
jgi:carotenoid cleavage dioxygenase-like enzyme